MIANDIYLNDTKTFFFRPLKTQNMASTGT